MYVSPLKALAGSGHKEAAGEHPGLDGIEFTVTNRSAHKVLVDGEWREPGEAVATLTTAWNEEAGAYTAQTAADALPCPDFGHGVDAGAVSDFPAEPCPENAESRVRNSDTNPVREPLSKPVKEEEGAQAREEAQLATLATQSACFALFETDRKSVV